MYVKQTVMPVVIFWYLPPPHFHDFRHSFSWKIHAILHRHNLFIWYIVTFFLNQENLISNKSFFLCHVSLHVHSTHRRSSRSLPLRLWFNSRLCQGKEWIRNEFQKLLLILILDLYPNQGWCQYCRAGAPAGKKICHLWWMENIRWRQTSTTTI